MTITLYKMCKLGRCWYSVSPEHCKDGELLKAEEFIVPEELKIRIHKSFMEHLDSEKDSVMADLPICTDVITGLPYILAKEKSGENRVYFEPVNKR